MNQDIARILITEEELQNRIAELAKTISADYEGTVPVFVGVLKGVVHFFTDFVTKTPLPCEYDFLAVSSYGRGTVSSGVINMQKDLSSSIEGRHVVILEDILDTGHTLKFVKEHLLSKKPASLKICTLLDKPERRQADITADYVGFTIPNEFVVGYGLDYREIYRNLPYIGILKPEVYQK
jgi:hypoxanthine phosphoribosyltransferase